MNTGIEQQVSVGDTPSGLQPTDPNNQLTTDSQDVEYAPEIKGVDDSVADYTGIATELSNGLVAAQEAFANLRALVAWRTTLEGYGDEPLTPQLQVATEVILDLTTRSAGLSSVDIIPSMEDLSNPTISVEALYKYAERLYEALGRLIERIGAFLSKLYTALTSRMRWIRAEVVILKSRLAIAKGGRAKSQRFKVGALGNLLAIRGIPVTTYSEFQSSMADVSALATACSSTHMYAIAELGKELNKIVESESFPNPRATEARLTRAFSSLGDTSLGLLCTKSVGSDPRFERAGYVTTASANLLGNKTVYKTKPRQGSELNDTFGTTTYSVDHTTLKVASYEPKADQTFDTLSLNEMGKLLDSCTAMANLVDRLDNSDVRGRVLESLSRLRNNTSKRGKDGSLKGETAELIQGAAVAFTDACSNPLSDLMGHLITVATGGIKLVGRSLDQFD